MVKWLGEKTALSTIERGSTPLSTTSVLARLPIWNSSSDGGYTLSAGIFLLSLCFPPSPPTLCAHSRLNPLFHGSIK
jgi:hypothetical protein